MTKLERLLKEIGLTEGMLELVAEGFATIEFKTVLNGRIRTVEEEEEYHLAEPQPDPNPMEPILFSEYEKQQPAELDIETKHNIAVETVEPVNSNVMLNAKVVNKEEEVQTVKVTNPLTVATPTDPFEPVKPVEDVKVPEPVFTEYIHPSENPRTKIVPEPITNKIEKPEWEVATNDATVDGTVISVPEETKVDENKVSNGEIQTVPWGTLNSNWMKF